MRLRITCLLAAQTLAAITARPSLGAWPNQPAVNLPLCRASGSQQYPEMIADGAGGAIVVWEDLRDGAYVALYAQHVLASGAVDPAWSSDGRALVTSAYDQGLPTMAADGEGGGIVAWEDWRGGATSDIYAQHVPTSVAADPAWPAEGRAVCTAANDQSVPRIVADGEGGAFVAWEDSRGGAFDIYAQHVLASGAVDSAWPADGLAVCTATSNQRIPKMVADGRGGAIVTWYDARGGPLPDIYAQHVLASGAVDPAWPADGRALCTAANAQFYPAIVTDGVGGAVVAWQDGRIVTDYNIYAQHLLASGAVDPAWPADGRALCAAPNDQKPPVIVADGAGGAIVAWRDARGGASYDIYAQRVLASGAVDPAWPADGRALCTAANDQNAPTIVGDGAGGAIVSWNDSRSGFYDIYAQHVLASGAVDPAWPADGRALCIAANDQVAPAISEDGVGGAIVAWHDFRAGTDRDIYAQRVERFGYLGSPEPVIASVRDVPNDQGGRAKLSWNSSYLDAYPGYEVASYNLWRSAPPGAAVRALAAGARLLGEGEEPAAGSVPQFRAVRTGAQVTYWEFIASQIAAGLAGYSYIAPTTSDSVGGANPPTRFMVEARHLNAYARWYSAPDSGYSVDNLAPAIPASFTGQYEAGVTHLEWGSNSEPDLSDYRLYRGTGPSFIPGPANLVASVGATSYVDAAGQPYWYKLSAVDIHGNESGHALLNPTRTTDVTWAGLPRELRLDHPRPDPAFGRATLSFSLPGAGRVSLTIHDTDGRLVRTLVLGVQPAGEHALEWDLRDETGHAVGAGLYLVSLETGDRAITRRFIALR